MAAAPSMQGQIVDFVQRLRRLGLPIAVDQLTSFADSFEWIQPLCRDELYHAARATLVNRREDLDLFDQAFVEFWEARRTSGRGQKTPQAPRHRPEAFQRPSLVSLMAERASAKSAEIEVTDRTETATDSEWLQRKEFSTLTEAERRALRRAMADLR